MVEEKANKTHKNNEMKRFIDFLFDKAVYANKSDKMHILQDVTAQNNVNIMKMESQVNVEKGSVAVESFKDFMLYSCKDTDGNIYIAASTLSEDNELLLWKSVYEISDMSYSASGDAAIFYYNALGDSINDEEREKRMYDDAAVAYFVFREPNTNKIQVLSSADMEKFGLKYISLISKPDLDKSIIYVQGPSTEEDSRIKTFRLDLGFKTEKNTYADIVVELDHTAFLNKIKEEPYAHMLNVYDKNIDEIEYDFGGPAKHNIVIYLVGDKIVIYDIENNTLLQILHDEKNEGSIASIVTVTGDHVLYGIASKNFKPDAKFKYSDYIDFYIHELDTKYDDLNKYVARTMINGVDILMYVSANDEEKYFDVELFYYEDKQYKKEEFKITNVPNEIYVAADTGRISFVYGGLKTGDPYSNVISYFKVGEDLYKYSIVDILAKKEYIDEVLAILDEHVDSVNIGEEDKAEILYLHNYKNKVLKEINISGPGEATEETAIRIKSHHFVNITKGYTLDEETPLLSISKYGQFTFLSGIGDMINVAKTIEVSKDDVKIEDIEKPLIFDKL